MKSKNNKNKYRIPSSRALNNGRNLTYSTYNDPPPMMNIPLEMKAISTVFSSGFAAAGSVLPIDLPPQGATSTSRVADRCRLSRIEVSGSIFVTNTQLARMIIFQTKGLYPPGSPPAVTDVLEYARADSPFKYNSRQLFSILCDHRMTCSSTGDTAIRSLEFSCKPAISDIRFVSSTSTAYNGQLFVLTIGSTGTGITPYNNYKVWFEDGN